MSLYFKKYGKMFKQTGHSNLSTFLFVSVIFIGSVAVVVVTATAAVVVVVGVVAVAIAVVGVGLTALASLFVIHVILEQFKVR